jgi:uncharacterized protein (DUF3084 family)
MEYIVHRLTEAAADSDMRQNMNVEDEYYSAIENRDTAIMNRDKKIKEQEKEILEKDKKLSEKDSQIRSLALALKDKGMSLQQIASLTGIDSERLKAILGS